MFRKSSNKEAPPNTSAVKSFSVSNATSTTNVSDTSAFINTLNDPDVVERVRVTIKHAHVFKLPPRQNVSAGWRGADWKEKVWQGTMKVVERGEMTAIILVDVAKDTIFAVCPVREGAVERCVDSSRYFVLRIENQSGRHMFIGVAFNERSDAFDFNTALEDSKREREAENVIPQIHPTKDYSLKEGEKIRVAIPSQISNSPQSDSGTPENKLSAAERRRQNRGSSVNSGGAIGFLKPSARDTPSRLQSNS